MAHDPRNGSLEANAEAGLRERKKARRRQEIVGAAAKLFARNGFDATTMAEIAHETGVSPPTVSNYFGSKENILSALIIEGTEFHRARHIKRPRKTGCSFAGVVGDLLCELTENTMRIAGKRVWRYVEAAHIRRPNTEFEKQFAYSDAELLRLIAAVLGDYDMVLRNRQPPDPGFLAKMLFDRWTARYFAYIKDENMSIEAHRAFVRADVKAIVSLVFDDSFAATSPLKSRGAIS